MERTKKRMHVTLFRLICDRYVREKKAHASADKNALTGQDLFVDDAPFTFLFYGLPAGNDDAPSRGEIMILLDVI